MIPRHQLEAMAKKTPLPTYGRSTPALLKKALIEAHHNDDRTAAYQALLRFAHSQGGLTDVSRELYAWVHEER